MNIYLNFIIIILLNILIIIFLSNNGINIQNTINFSLDRKSNAEYETHYRISPVITDIDNDGLNEVILIDNSFDLLLMKYDSHTHSFVIKNETSIIQNKFSVGSFPIFLTTSSITSIVSNKNIHSSVSHYILIITDNLSLLLFDYRFVLKWTNSIQTNFIMNSDIIFKQLYSTIFLKESIIIIAYQLDSSNINLKNSNYIDKFVVLSFNLLTGELLWKNDGETNEENHKSDDYIYPQYDVHYDSFQDWRTYRNSIFASLFIFPHRYQDSIDRSRSAILIDHFDKNKKGSDEHVIPKHSDDLKERLENLIPSHSVFEHVKDPNVVIVHHRTGISIYHLNTGLFLFTISLNPYQLHIDLNGDNIIDHIQLIMGEYTPLYQRRGFAGHEISAPSHLPKCLAFFSTGEQGNSLIQFDICDSRENNIRGLTPVALHHHQELFSSFFPFFSQFIHSVASRSIFKLKSSYYHVVFFLSNGDVIFTHLDPLSPILSKKNTLSSFHDFDNLIVNDNVNKIMKNHYFPSLTPYHLKSYSHHFTDDDLVIVIGKTHLSLVSLESVIQSLQLPKDNIITTPTVGDINNDGLNDIVLQSSKMLYFYFSEEHYEYRLFIILSVLLIIIVGILLFIKLVYFQHSSSYLHKE